MPNSRNILTMDARAMLGIRRSIRPVVHCSDRD